MGCIPPVNLTVMSKHTPLVTPPDRTPPECIPGIHIPCPIACWDTPPGEQTDTCKKITIFVYNFEIQIA